MGLDVARKVGPTEFIVGEEACRMGREGRGAAAGHLAQTAHNLFVGHTLVGRWAGKACGPKGEKALARKAVISRAQS